MKIYLYNPETGVYLGEDYADEPWTKGNPAALPFDATTKQPPPPKAGSICLFDCVKNIWELRPLPLVEQSLKRSKVHYRKACPGGTS